MRLLAPAPCAQPTLAVARLALLARLRGGTVVMGISRREFFHSVLLALVSNTAAVMLQAAVTDSLKRTSATQTHTGSRILLALANTAITFLAYLLVFALTGFVPMGYVTSAAPLLSAFRPPPSR